MFIGWIFILGFASLIIQLGGFVTPRWILYKDVDKRVELGIWYSCTSDQCYIYDSQINRHDLPQEFSEVTSPGVWLEFQIETSIGVVTAVFALSLTWGWWKTTIKFVGVLATLAFWVSGIATWVPAGKMIEFYMRIGKHHADSIYYAVVLSCIGATMAFITSIAILICVSRTKKRPADDEYALHQSRPSQERHSDNSLQPLQQDDTRHMLETEPSSQPLANETSQIRIQSENLTQPENSVQIVQSETEEHPLRTANIVVEPSQQEHQNQPVKKVVILSKEEEENATQPMRTVIVQPSETDVSISPMKTVIVQPSKTDDSIQPVKTAVIQPGMDEDYTYAQSIKRVVIEPKKEDSIQPIKKVVIQTQKAAIIEPLET